MNVDMRDAGPRLLVILSCLPFGWLAGKDKAIKWTVS